MSTRSTLFVALAVLLLAALPAAAAEPVYRGTDAWTTVPVGTYADLRANPIPAGFFCAESPAFDGQIYLRGVHLVTDKGTLRKDTIVERLDDAVFNKRGVAFTRVRVRALQLTGVETFKNVCGEYKVFVTLDGSEQPISRMKIIRESNRGGRFMVPLSINTKIVFTRVDNEAEQLEFSDPVHFPPNPLNRWSYRRFAPTAKAVGPLMVDTDWDGSPDTFFSGSSNFAPGWSGKALEPIFEGTHVVTE
jgi:hypothetical protein